MSFQAVSRHLTHIPTPSPITLPPFQGILTHTHLSLIPAPGGAVKGHHPALWQQKSASPCLDPPVTMSPMGHLIHSLTGPKGGPSLPSFSSQSAKAPWLSHPWEGPGLWTLWKHESSQGSSPEQNSQL